jgi:predicted transcriptional regulator
MPPLPEHHPKRLSLGPLETEILEILWHLGDATAKAIHDVILADIDRELTYSSVATVLKRLEQKGWVAGYREGRSLRWRSLVSRHNADILKAHDQLQQFLASTNLDVVAAFADTLDEASLNQLEAITQKIQAIRRAKGGQP